MLTRQQAIALESRCRFLSVQDTLCPQYREFMSSLQLFGNFGDVHCSSCRLQKVIPAQNRAYFKLFLMHHLSNGSLDGGVTHGGMPIWTHFGGIQQCVLQAKWEGSRLGGREVTVCRHVVVNRTGVVYRLSAVHP